MSAQSSVHTLFSLGIRASVLVISGVLLSIQLLQPRMPLGIGQGALAAPSHAGEGDAEQPYGTDDPDRSVGVLYAVFQQTSSPRSLERVLSFVDEAVSSARHGQRVVPGIRIALATNFANITTQQRSAFATVVSMSLSASELEVPWLPRLHALRHSPWRLTLLMDSHAVLCSPRLHAALTLEHEANRFDLAINFEASVGLESTNTSNPRASSPPHHLMANRLLRFGSHPLTLLPHNWALLLRRGRAADELLLAWEEALRRMQWPDDQLALRWALQRLDRRGCVDTRPCGQASRTGSCAHHAISEGRADGRANGRTGGRSSRVRTQRRWVRGRRGCVLVRVVRLREILAACIRRPMYLPMYLPGARRAAA